MILEDQKERVYRGIVIMRDTQEKDPLIALRKKEGIFTESIQDTTRESLAENTEATMVTDQEAGVSLSLVMRGGIDTVEAEDLQAGQGTERRSRGQAH